MICIFEHTESDFIFDFIWKQSSANSSLKKHFWKFFANKIVQTDSILKLIIIWL